MTTSEPVDCYYSISNNSNQPAPTLRKAKDAVQYRNQAHQDGPDKVGGMSAQADSRNLRNRSTSGGVDARSYILYLRKRRGLQAIFGNASENG